LATGVLCEEVASPPSCSLDLDEKRDSKERRYSLTDGQERAAGGHSDCINSDLGGDESVIGDEDKDQGNLY